MKTKFHIYAETQGKVKAITIDAENFQGTVIQVGSLYLNSQEYDDLVYYMERVNQQMNDEESFEPFILQET